jgi:hypothetical protein
MLVSLGASGADLTRLGWVGTVLDYYAMLSGANEQYAFFAPGVSSQIGVLFDLIDKEGNERTVTLESGLNHETELRIGNIFGEFQNDAVSDPAKLHRAVAASFVGTMFGRYPGTKEVRVRLQEFTPVSMQEHREGKRPQWNPIYQARYKYAAK